MQNLRPAVLALVMVLLASAPAAADVCTEFLEEHPYDESWEKACLGFLESLPQEASLELAGAQSAPESLLLETLALHPLPPVNLSRDFEVEGSLGLPGNQHEVFIAIDPKDRPLPPCDPEQQACEPPKRLFAISKSEPFDSLFVARSESYFGRTWTPSTLADGNPQPGGAPPIPAGASDPWAVFDPFGNLWVSYLGLPGVDSLTHVVRSTNEGVSFALEQTLQGISGITDRPVMATGPSVATKPGESAVWSVWVMYHDLVVDTIFVQGAALRADGSVILDFCEDPTAPPADAFCPRRFIASGNGATMPPELRTGDLAIGSGGEVLVTYQLDTEPRLGPTEIFLTLDEDGLGSSGFSDPTPSSTGPDFVTNVGFKESISAQSTRGITLLPNLAWDLDTTRHGSRGRVHLVYTTEEPQNSGDTDIVYHYSDNAGMENAGVSSWVPDPTQPQAPVHVNDDTTGSQFFPEIAVDQTTGDVAVAWHDARDSTANTETDLYVTVKLDSESTFLPNVRVGEGMSMAVSSNNSYGDYLGVAFHDGVIHPVWVDNSNSTDDNPDADPEDRGPTCGSMPCMDPYTAAVVLPEPGAASQLLAGATALIGLARRRARSARLARARHSTTQIGLDSAAPLAFWSTPT